MTTVAVLADPPRPGAVLTDLVDADLLSPAEATDLYAAMLGDVCRAIEHSGGDLLVNYRPEEQAPGDGDSEAEIREALAGALADPEDARYEVQVGSSFSARAGNTVTHLLEGEDVATAAVVTPTAAFLGRQQVDSAAMRLRRESVVLGPSTDGQVYYAGFREPVDFEDAFENPALETLVDRAADAGLGAGYLPMLPVIERPRDLTTALPMIDARRRSESRLPERTAACLEEIGLRVESEDGEPTPVRD